MPPKYPLTISMDRKTKKIVDHIPHGFKSSRICQLIKDNAEAITGIPSLATDGAKADAVLKALRGL